MGSGLWGHLWGGHAACQPRLPSEPGHMYILPSPQLFHSEGSKEMAGFRLQVVSLWQS